MANALQDAYQSNYQQMQSQGAYNPLSMENQTLEGITDQLAAVYRPQLEQQILNRYGATKKQKAAIDVDAASRGMGTSTWVTDAKNRLMNAEAADIAGMERDYASQLAGDALNQYNQYLQDRQNLDRYNQSLAIQLGDTAYGRAADQYNAGLIDGTLPQMQNQLAYNQAAWQFGRAKEQAPLEDRMNQLAYDQNYLNYLQSQWQFEQAKKAAANAGRGGSPKPDTELMTPEQFQEALAKALAYQSDLTPGQTKINYEGAQYTPQTVGGAGSMNLGFNGGNKVNYNQ